MFGTNKFAFFSFCRLPYRCAAPFLSGVVPLLIITTSVSAGQQPAVPPAPLSPLEQAEKLLKEEKSDEALLLLTTFAQKHPQAPGLEADLGEAYFQSRRFPEASSIPQATGCRLILGLQEFTRNVGLEAARLG